MSSSANRIIDISDVKLKTLSVEIGALVVNGKQMTLSVFRQIPKKNIFDNNMSMVGLPWGNINYFWKDNEGDLHVVWQDGNILYRHLALEPKKYHYYQGLQSYEKMHLENLKNKQKQLVSTIESFRKYLLEDNCKSIEYYNNSIESDTKNLELIKKEIDDIVKNDESFTKLAIENFEKDKKAYENLLLLPQLFIAM